MFFSQSNSQSLRLFNEKYQLITYVKLLYIRKKPPGSELSVARLWRGRRKLERWQLSHAHVFRHHACLPSSVFTIGQSCVIFLLNTTSVMYYFSVNGLMTIPVKCLNLLYSRRTAYFNSSINIHSVVRYNIRIRPKMQQLCAY